MLIGAVSFLFFGKEKDILEGAFLAADVELKEESINYTTQEGVRVTVPAFAGQVEIFTAAETSPDDIKGFVSGHGGKIIAQAPTVGIYIAEVSVGKEAGLIEALLKEDWVIDAHPYIPLDKNQAEYILDFWKEPSRERSHGAAVCYYVIGQAECAKEILDRCFGNRGCQEAEWPMFYQIIREIKAQEKAPFIIFNLSLGPKTDDKNGKPISAAAVEAAHQAYFGMLLQILGHDDLAGVEKTVIVNSAGNDGADLTSVFRSLSSSKGFSRLVVVGAVTPAGKISPYTNYSRGERDIMYSVGGEKAIPMAGKYLTWTGTSFAAPQITCLLNNWLRKSPDRAANPQELRDSVFDANIGKDSGRGFQYRYFINPCLAEESAEETIPQTSLPPPSPEEEVSTPSFTEPGEDLPPPEEEVFSPLPPLPPPTSSLSPSPSPPPSPPPPPELETTVIISSNSCRYVWSAGSDAYSDYHDYEAIVSGSASGPVGTDISLEIIIGDWGLTGREVLDCGSWSKSGSRCVRQMGQGESTSWSVRDTARTATSLGGSPSLPNDYSLTSYIYSKSKRGPNISGSCR